MDLNQYLVLVLICSCFPSCIHDNVMENVLEYMYTQFNSSHYEVFGILDGEPLDFYSSVSGSYIPKKQWNEVEGSFNHTVWKDSVLAREHIDKLFPLYANVLFKARGNSGGDIVQMRLGCKTNTMTGFAELGYNGENGLHLQDSRHTNYWTPDDENYKYKYTNILNSAKWQKTRDRIGNFIHQPCLDQLSTFVHYERKNTSDVPRIYKMGLPGPGLRNLSCLITGFYPKSTHITVKWFKNGVRLTEEGWSLGPRPNENHTYQLRIGLKVTDSQSDFYQCEVDYPGRVKPWIGKWNIDQPTSYSFALVSTVSIFLVIILVVGLCFCDWKKNVYVFVPGRKAYSTCRPKPTPRRECSSGACRPRACL